MSILAEGGAVKRLLWIPIVAACLVACAAPTVPVLTPAAGDYGPCGIGWHQCAPVTPVACCLENWACGGPQADSFTSCAPGACCDDSPLIGMGATRRVMAQRRP